MSELLFYGGIIVCGVTAIGAIITSIILHFVKIRLDEQFDSEYGKRRH